jgi:hypothetical protein
MKLPSLQSLWHEALAVFRRFPLQVLVTIVAVGVCILRIETPSLAYLDKLLACCNFALTLLLAADLFAETHDWSVLKKWFLRVLVLVICTVLYLLLNPVLYEADVIRIVLLGFAFHLLVSFAPFIGRGMVGGFWAYNERLFLQIITAGIFSFVLTIGLYIAVGSTDALFDLKMSGHVYGYIVCLTMVGFMTIFFLSGVPKDFRALNEVPQEYPKWLKIFTQYVLIPLLSVYLLILLAYEGKILISWTLPKGYVSTLILGYAVAGILSLLLIYPIRNREGNGWMRIFARFFYVMLIPLVVLLLLAVWKRVSVYGITEARYILILLALWLTIVTVYNLFSKQQNIKFIPVSLCILALLAVYGPQSAFMVSKYSQTKRLEKMLKQDDTFAQKEKPQIISYLVQNHGILALQSFTSRNLKPLQDRFEQRVSGAEWKYDIKARQVDTALAILKVSRQLEKTGFEREVLVSSGNTVQVKGYDYYKPLIYHIGEEEFELSGSTIKVARLKDQKVTISIDGKTATLSITPLLNQVQGDFKAGTLGLLEGRETTYKMPASVSDMPFETSTMNGVFRLTDVYVNDGKAATTMRYEGYFLLRLKTTK